MLPIQPNVVATMRLGNQDLLDPDLPDGNLACPVRRGPTCSSVFGNTALRVFASVGTRFYTLSFGLMFLSRSR